MNGHVHFNHVVDRNRTFVVSRDPKGLWIAHEQYGRVEGVFRTQREAVRFALFETGSPGSVVVIAGGDGSAPTVH